MIAPAGVPTLKDYGRILLSGWALIVAAAVLSAGVAWLATSFVEPSYTAASRVFVTAPGPPSPKNSLDGNRGSLVRVESYVQLATGEQVLRRVIASQDLPIEPAELKKDITVLPSPGSALIEISVVNADADRARDIANSVAVQLVKLAAEIDLGPTGRCLNLLWWTRPPLRARQPAPNARATRCWAASWGSFSAVCLCSRGDFARFDRPSRPRRTIAGASHGEKR